MDKITYFCILLMIAASSQIYYVDEDSPINFDDINIEEEMKKAEIIPDLLQNGPQKLLMVKFPDQPDLIPGQRLYNGQYLRKPEFFYDYENRTYYALYMSRLTKYSYSYTQEDYTIDPFYNLTYGRNELCYWAIVNIWENNIFDGHTLVDYGAPMDLIGSFDRRSTTFKVCERYSLLLYKQQHEITEIQETEERSTYFYSEMSVVGAFAQDYDLGEPLAGNFFVSYWW